MVLIQTFGSESHPKRDPIPYGANRIAHKALLILHKPACQTISVPAITGVGISGMLTLSGQPPPMAIFYPFYNRGITQRPLLVPFLQVQLAAKIVEPIPITPADTWRANS